MTEDEKKTIKAWAYDKIMDTLYDSAHYSKWVPFNLDLDAIVKFIKIMAPDRYKDIKEKIKKEKEQESNGGND